MGIGLKFLFEKEVTMKQGTNLGSQIGRWIILAAVGCAIGRYVAHHPASLCSSYSAWRADGLDRYGGRTNDDRALLDRAYEVHRRSQDHGLQD